MQLILAAVGRMKKGPEQELASRYLDRVSKSGKSIGLTQTKVVEIVESRAGSSDTRKREEAESLLGRLPENCVIFAFDERGMSPDSRQFAKLIGTELNDGKGALALIIGGPDGLAPEIRQRAKKVISFGAATFPHQLVRILVLEQVYRSVTILTNHPYHRD